MKLQLLYLSTLLLASLPLAAQTPSGYGVTGTVGPGSDSATPRKFVYNFDHMQRTEQQTAPASCPVSMRATQKVNGGLMNARSGDRGQPGQRIHLDVDRSLNAVTSARVTVHGTTAKPRVSSAELSQREGSDAAISFTLQAESREAANISSDLPLRGFTSVQSVSLDSLTYADGSIWKPALGRSCSVALDPTMLVSAR